MKKMVVFVVVATVFILSLTACGRQSQESVSEKTEIEKVEEIRIRYEKEDGVEKKTYDLQDWEKIYYLGVEGELVLLEKGDNVILADDPNVGNAIYEEGVLEMGMELQGAGAYIRVKDVFGFEYGIRTIRDPKDIRVGIGQNLGDQIKTPLSEMPDEEQDYIPISSWDWVQPTTN